MARPSVANERRKQIMEATLATMTEHGISGTTLDRIAESAEMSRGHVRHFLGNRDEILVNTVRYFYADDSGSSAILPTSVATLDEAIDYLFGEEFTASDSENTIVLGFVEAARTNPQIAAVLAEAYSQTRERLHSYIVAAHPEADPASCENVAQGVLSASLGNVFIGDFDSETGRTSRTRYAVKALLSTL